MDKRVLLLVYPAALAIPAMFFQAMLWFVVILAASGLPLGLNMVVYVLVTILTWPFWACLVFLGWDWGPTTVLPLYYFLTFIWLVCLGIPFVIRRQDHCSSPA